MIASAPLLRLRIPGKGLLLAFLAGFIQQTFVGHLLTAVWAMPAVVRRNAGRAGRGDGLSYRSKQLCVNLLLAAVGKDINALVRCRYCAAVVAGVAELRPLFTPSTKASGIMMKIFIRIRQKLSALIAPLQ